MQGLSISIDNKVAKVSGELGFANANSVLQQYPSLPEVALVDLSGLTQVDSAGLSVLLHWHRAANVANSKWIISGVPKQLELLINIAGLETALLENTDASVLC